MKINVIIGVWLISLLSIGIIVLPKELQPALVTIEPAPPETLKPIVDKIHATSSFSENDNDHIGYIVDINNDGKDEYVFLDSSALSEGYLWLDIFMENNGIIKKLKKPESLCLPCNNDGYPSYNMDSFPPYNFVHPITHKTQLFIRANNKTYICGSTYNCVWENCIWENNEIKQAAEHFWVKEQRNLFSELYKKEEYEKAFALLDSFEKTHRHMLDSQTDLWIKNDLTLAALRDNFQATALKILENIESDAQFSEASPALKKAVKTNKSLCYDAIKKYTKYDYSWLLSYKELSNNKLFFDSRFDSLLAATIPDMEGMNFKDCLCGPGEDDVQVLDNRYVIFSGFFPHSAMNKGFMWCDIQKNLSVVAFGLAKSEYGNSRVNRLDIFSRSTLKNDLPRSFLEELKKWIVAEKIDHAQIIFHDRLGKESKINAIQHG